MNKDDLEKQIISEMFNNDNINTSIETWDGTREGQLKVKCWNTAGKGVFYIRNMETSHIQNIMKFILKRWNLDDPYSSKFLDMFRDELRTRCS